MDKKDERILNMINMNSRLSINEISKKVMLKPETTRYRIKKLEEELNIKYITIINPAKLGFQPYEFLFRLKNIVQSEVILSKLKKICNWVSEISGDYNLGVIVAARNHLELLNIQSELRELLPDIIESKLILLTSAKFLKGGYEIIKEGSIDELDLLILEIISSGARDSALNIASRLNVATDTVIRRIKRMENEEIITGYTAYWDYTKMGKKHIKLLFNNATWTDNPNIISQIITLGAWDLEIDALVTSTKEIDEILSIPFDNYKLLEIKKTLEFNFLPKNIFGKT